MRNSQASSHISNASPSVQVSSAKKRYSHRDSHRNFFRREQQNKELVSKLRRSQPDSPEQASPEKLRTAQNVSKHDQNLGGQQEHHGSQHEESQLKQFTEEAQEDPDEVNSTQQWHDVKVIASEAGS